MERTERRGFLLWIKVQHTDGLIASIFSLVQKVHLACTKGTPRLYKRYIIEDDIYELDCWDREYAKGVNDVQEIIEKRLTEVENG